ncbi:hypothetical protein BGZ73_000125 [Actinomortierella ambigua]|nr:hypothetical protein BGZ73_000125 [Actinomortierella ambigua]
MSSPVKAAATIQDNVLLVQYSPTGNGVGDLYAILLSNPRRPNGGGPIMSLPLPFQIQRQVPDLQGPKFSIASMSLATVPSSTDTNPSTPGSSPPSPPMHPPGSVDGSGPSSTIAAPPAYAQSTIEPHPYKSAAVTAAPFRDYVLAVNGADSTSRVWHVKAPSRSFIPTGGSGPGVGPITEPATPNIPPTSSWGAFQISPSLFPNAISITLGTHTPQDSKQAGILAVMQTNVGTLQLSKLVNPSDSGSVGSPTPPSTQAPPSTPSSTPGSGSGGGDGGNINNAAAAAAGTAASWQQSWTASVNTWYIPTPQPGLTIYPATVPPSARNNGGYSEALAGQCSSGADSWCMMFMHDPPTAMPPSPIEHHSPRPPSPCYTSTSSAMVAIVADQVYVNEFALAVGSWNLVSRPSFAPIFHAPVVACVATDDFIVAVVPDTRSAQPRPQIHLFDFVSSSWINTHLSQAPPGTFGTGDFPPLSGDLGEGGLGPPANASASSSSRTAIIGGVVGGIVVLGLLIFAGFFFRRRRGTKEKAHHRNLFALKPLVGDDALHKEQQSRDSEMGGGHASFGTNRGASLETMSAQMTTVLPRAMTPLGYDPSTTALMTCATLTPVSGTVGVAGDKCEISDHEIQTISLRPPSAVGSHASLVDDNSLEIVTHVGRSRSNIRGAGGSSSASGTPISTRMNEADQLQGTGGDRSPVTNGAKDAMTRKDSIGSETIRTEPITPGLAHAQLILQESQRRPPMHHHHPPPVPAVNQHYAAYQPQAQHQPYPQQPGNYR